MGGAPHGAARTGDGISAAQPARGVNVTAAGTRDEPAALPAGSGSTRRERAQGVRDPMSTAAIAVLVVGPLPPPVHGGAVATQYVLNSPLAERFRLLHLDTTDRRGLDNVGRLDAGNVWLALRHAFGFMGMLAAARPRVVLVPIAQNRLGYLRDCLFLLPALLARRSVVVHVHAGSFRAFHDTTDPFTRALIRFTLKRAARAIVLGESLRATVRGLVPDARVAVVPNGIADPFEGVVPSRETRRVCTVLYLGTLMAAKGFLDVLAAAKLLAEQDGRLRFVFAGGFFRPADERQARSLLSGSAASVEFTGPVTGETKAELLRQADVLVFPTRYANEAHPYVILEGMAAGLPVITTARAAIPETVQDGETGVLVPEGDVAALARAIARLASDPALRQRMGHAARRRFEDRYRLTRWAEQMETVLRAAGAR